MRERNLETGLEYADVDLFGLRMRAGRAHVPSWHGAQIYCLKHRDYDAAELIASRNLISDECAGGACDDCHFRWCPCPHHSAVQFAIEHAQIPLHQPIAVDDEESEAA